MSQRRFARRMVRSLALLSVLSGLSAVSASAATWEPLPLWGGSVQVAAALGRPTVIYAASPTAGIYRSADGGGSWQFVAYGPNRFQTRILGVDPHDQRRLYAAATDPAGSYRGFFRSRDGGKSWRQSDARFPAATVFDVAFDPRTAGVVYAATSKGLFRSRDNGIIWAALPALGRDQVTQVAVAPRNPDVVIASVFAGNHGTTQRSTDGGQSFAEILDRGAAEVVFDPTRPRRVYGLVFSEVLHSDDLGATWKSGTPLLVSVQTLAVTRTGALLAGGYERGVLRSPDGGATWLPVPERIGTALPHDSVFSLVALDDGVLAGGSRGVWRSLADGREWKASSTGIRAQYSVDLDVAADAESTLWASTFAGFFEGGDRGETFRSRLGPLGSRGFVEILEVHPQQPQIAYAFACCAEDPDGGQSYGVLKTEDGGGSWRLLPYNGVLREVGVLEVDPKDPDFVYAGGFFQPHSGPCTAERSTDGGDTWSCMPQLGSRDFTGLAIDPSEPRILYAVAGGGEVYRSGDHGASWTLISTQNHGIGSLEVDPHRSERLYALSSSSFLRSDDGGVTWTAKLSAQVGTMRDFLLDPSRPGRIWATAEYFEIGEVGKSTSRVFRSDDAGEHWHEVSGGLKAGTVVLQLAADPRSADVLYAGTAGQGLFRLDLTAEE